METNFKVDAPSFALGYSAGKKKGGGGGAELNIHYSLDTPPEDTTALWVKSDKAAKGVLVDQTIVYEGDAQPEQFVTLSTTIDSTSQSPACAAVGDKIYVFGGTNRQMVGCFDTAKNTYANLAAYVNTRSTTHMAACAVGSKIYIFGGRYSSGSSYVYPGTCYEFDTETEELTVLDVMFQSRQGVNMAGAGCIAVGTDIYLFGGYSYNNGDYVYLDDFQVFDAITKSFKYKGPMADSRANVSVAMVGNLVLVFGGYGNKTGYPKKVIATLAGDSEHGTYYLETEMPYSRCDAGVITYNKTVMLICGDQGGTAKNTVLCYDLEKDSWSTSQVTAPSALKDLGSAAVKNSCYLFGGYTGSSTKKTIYKYDVPVRAPTLENGKLHIVPNLSSNLVKLSKTDALDIKIGVTKTRMGNSKNESEIIESAVYKNNKWTSI